MALVVTIIGIAFAALCVWLIVRIVNRGWMPGRRFWLWMPLIMAIAYPLSVGPLEWCFENGLMPTPIEDGLRIIFAPLGCMDRSCEWFREGMKWYLRLWDFTI